MSSRGFVEGPVRVRVPATSANLGPGFDSLGLALSLHDEVTAEVTGDGQLHLEIDGEGCDDVPRDDTHLMISSMYRAFDLLDGRPDGLAVHCGNVIPHSRGLGSSAAAIVAGVSLARALVVDGGDRMDDHALLELAAGIEGHPDNVAPCLLGALTIAWTSGSTIRALRLEVDPDVRPVALVPAFTASTEAARGLLPATVPHADAAFTAGRSALLIAALTTAPDTLLDATEDRLHQSYREPAMPASHALVTALRTEGLPAVISGAGPTVMVLARGELEVERALAGVPTGWSALELEVDIAGAMVTT